MKKTLKRVVSLLLLSALLLSGCGKKEQDKQAGGNSAVSKDYVYRVEAIPMNTENGENASNVFYLDDKIVLLGYKWIEETGDTGATDEETQTGDITEDESVGDGAVDMPTVQPRTYNETATEAGATEAAVTEEVATEAAATLEEDRIDYVEDEIWVDEEIWVEEYPVYTQKLYIAVYDYEGNEISYTEIDVDPNSWLSWATASETEDAVYVVFEKYEEDYSDPDNYIYKEYRDLFKLRYDGTEEWKVSINELSEEEFPYVSCIKSTADGKLLLFLQSGETYVLDESSQITKQFVIQEENLGEILVSDSGKVLCTIWGEQGMMLKEIDMETGKTLPTQYKVPGNSYNYSYYAGVGYDVFLTDYNGLYGYNLGDETITKIMDYVDSDLDASGLYNVHAVSDTQFYATYYSYSGNATCYASFTKVPPEEIVDKKTLILGCAYMDSSVRTEVIKFNKSSEEYRIKIKDYSSYNTEEDYTLAYSTLNSDIVSGNIPDIIMLDETMPIASYQSKGLFEDLYPYIDNDPDMDREDYLTNIFDAYGDNGKMYRLIPNFTVATVVAKTSEVGAEPGWTLDELNALMETKPEDMQIIYDTIREVVLSNAMQYTGNQFVNWETGECNFDSEGFIQLLEFVNQFPEEFDESRYNDDSYWMSYESIYRDNKALLNMTYMYEFREFNRMEKGMFGEDVTLIGFPTTVGNGSAISQNMSLAMSSKTDYKEGAWEFMKVFLSYEYQKEQYGFPTNRQCFDEFKQEAMQKPYFIDEGNKVEYDETYYINGVEIIIPPLTAEEAQEIEDFILSLDQTIVYDQDLVNIIQEEAAAYFSGQKSAKEVAGIIQSRAKIYVNENR